MNTATKKPVVLITGATGSTGTNAIAKLLELSVPVRALVHKVDERSEKLSAQGVEIAQGDLSDFEVVSEALTFRKSVTALPSLSSIGKGASHCNNRRQSTPACRCLARSVSSLLL
jgi:uncharacterized protein YbjT (DUF2867 family)